MTATVTVLHSVPIPGWPGYSATPDGQIIGRYGRPLTPQPLGAYRRVNLAKSPGRGGCRRHVLVHRLVAAAFHGPCPAGHEVNHIDGDGANNAAVNLEYLTPTANVRHALDVLGRERAPGERNGNARLTADVVRTIRAAHAAGENAASIGRRLDINGAHCWRICTGRSWRHIA